jgi:DNA replication ATP-dependent helicase Dna2
MVYAAASEAVQPGPPAGSILQTHKALLDKFAGRLHDDDLTYFVTWDRLVDLEGNSSISHMAEAWLVDSLERERTTLRCMSSLFFESGDDGDGSSVLLTFQRSRLSSQQNSLQNLSFEHGCHVVISTDNTTASSQTSLNRPHMHVVRGQFEHASENRVSIRASPDDLSRLRRVIQRSGDLSGPLFRLDRDEVATGLGTLRQNLVNLFSRDSGQDLSHNRFSWLRDVVVRLKPPSFDHTKKDAMFDPPANLVGGSYPGCDFMDLYLEYAELNDDQRAAADNVLAAKDYSMIQGLPGTGKTSTIAFLARLLVAHGKRVLITSYTNSAVDNVLLKLMASGLAATSPTVPSPVMIRIGRDTSTHPYVRSILAASAAIAFENSFSTEGDAKGGLPPSADSLAKCVHAARVVGATALTIPRSPLLVKEHFDVVIVDEAGQITQPAVLGALMSADSFILVGDHKQLPPLVANEVAEMGGERNFRISCCATCYVVFQKRSHILSYCLSRIWRLDAQTFGRGSSDRRGHAVVPVSHESRNLHAQQRGRLRRGSEVRG